MKNLIFVFLLGCGSLTHAQFTESDSLEDIKLMQNLGFVVEGSAKAKGVIASILLDKELLKSKLPKNLELQPIAGVPENLHPVGLFIGKHFDLKAIIGDSLEIPIKNVYTELTFGISNVKIKGSGSSRTYTYISDLRLDSWRAIMMGRLYGFPKKQGQFSWTQDSPEGQEMNGSPLIIFEMSKVENYDVNKFEANLNFLKANLKPIIVELNGELKCIDFDWRLENAKLSPVKTSFSLFKSFVGIDITHITTTSLDENPFGSLYVETDWIMSSPHKCQ